MEFFFLSALFIVIAAAFCLFVYCENNRLVVTRYAVQSQKIGRPVRIVQLSDLHNKQFGKKNAELFRVVMEQRPDMIVFTGDLEDRRQSYNRAAADFLTELAKKLPVYFVFGNQEMRGGFKNRLAADLKKGCVRVLDNECAEIKINGNRLAILGLNDFRVEKERFALRRGKRLMLQFERSAQFKLLLTHYPHYFDRYKKKYRYCAFKLDLVLSGHAHGGLIRLPFIKGVIAPGQGLFPRFTAGIYQKSGARMIVSRGLGNSGWPRRIFNKPEIVVVDLTTGL
jgi:uncharacterized protein